MLTPEFTDAVRCLVEAGQAGRTAIMCAERLPSECHRSFISDILVIGGVAVGHIIAAGGAQSHALSAQARRAGDGLVYDAGAQLVLDSPESEQGSC